MALRDFVITQFKYATPTYSISSLNDIKRIIYLNKKCCFVLKNFSNVLFQNSHLKCYKLKFGANNCHC